MAFNDEYELAAGILEAGLDGDPSQAAEDAELELAASILGREQPKRLGLPRSSAATAAYARARKEVQAEKEKVAKLTSVIETLRHRPILRTLLICLGGTVPKTIRPLLFGACSRQARLLPELFRCLVFDMCSAECASSLGDFPACMIAFRCLPLCFACACGVSLKHASEQPEEGTWHVFSRATVWLEG